MNSTNHANRILWVDLYKALAIILVVIGHATSLFNIYIYQFHLAAFFLISGYVAKQKNISCLEIVLKKLYTILLPLFMFVLIFAGVMFVLFKTENYNFWLSNLDYIGAGNIIKYFLLYGNLYVWWLGAAWFLVVLFFVAIASKIIYVFACENDAIYLLLSFFIYLGGYYYIGMGGGGNLPYYLDLVPIAQFFYCIGFILNNTFKDRLIEIKCCHVWWIVICTMCIGYFLGKIPNVQVDYVARDFHSIGLNTLACMNGIVLLWGITQLIVKIGHDQVTAFLCLIGQNTLGILLLHFMFFKVSYLLLYLMGIISQNDIGRFLPEESVGNQYWWMIAGISILISVYVWLLLKKIPGVSRVLGLDWEWYKQKENLLKNSRTFCLYLDKVSKIMKFYDIRKRISYVVITVAVLMIVGFNIREFKNRNSSLEITFPNNLSIVPYSDGWLEQGCDEPYRWISGNGTITIQSNCHSRVKLEGYVPADFDEVTNIKIWINKELKGDIDISDRGGFFGDYEDIPYNDGQVEIKILFNGVHKPNKISGETRKLSGLINKIQLE